MKAIIFDPGRKDLKMAERPEPRVTRPDEVKLRMMKVGVCGTDRERIAEGKATPPRGLKDIVIGHENMGMVVEAGSSVTSVKAGDLAAFTIRRGCGECTPCNIGRPDMCRTGNYMDRGLSGIDGFNAEYAVDREEYVVKVPEGLGPVGVLLEPMSVVEKAIGESMRLQFARLPDALSSPDWLYGKKALVAGIGNIGLLAALALRLRGAEVYGLDIVDSSSVRVKWLLGIGGYYIDGRSVKPEKVDEVIGPIDMVVEAAGVPGLEFGLFDTLARDGIYVVAGIPSEEVHGGKVTVNGAELMSRLVRMNLLVFGSVSSAAGHFRTAIDDFIRAEYRWKGHLGKMITAELDYTDFKGVLTSKDEKEIKSVIKWAA
jgi:threonine dehydrogenase-like Zn-dependent dehydrogenase